MRIAHIADIHIKPEKNHRQYKKCFNWMFDYFIEQKIDYVFISGDILHSYTNTTPELVEIVSWFFKSLSNICETKIIIGNHDQILSNPDKKNLIKIILDELELKNIELYTKTGIYPISNEINLIPFPLENKNNWSTVTAPKNKTNIALFHGMVNGCLADNLQKMESNINIDFFKNKNIDFALLGDLHLQQIIDERITANNKKMPWIAYCGSTICQNYGETPEKGGLIWEINDKNDWNVYGFVIPNDNPYVSIEWENNIVKTISKSKKFPSTSHFRIIHDVNISPVEKEQLRNELYSLGAKEVVFKSNYEFDFSEIKTKTLSASKKNILEVSTHKKLLKEYFSENKNVGEDQLNELIKLTEKYLPTAKNIFKFQNSNKWNLKSLEFSNLFGYGENNKIDFKQYNNLIGVSGKNRAGKSSIMGALMFALYGATDRGSIKNLSVINRKKENCRTRAIISINKNYYLIEREIIKKKGRKNINAISSVSFKQIDENENIIENFDETLKYSVEDKIKEKIGDKADFELTAFAAQNEITKFIKEGSTNRKLYINKFLGLNIFEKIHELAKEDFDLIKAQFKSSKEKNWDLFIQEQLSAKKENNDRLVNLKKELEELSTEKENLKIKLFSFKSNGNFVSKSEIEAKKEEVEKLSNKKANLYEELGRIDNLKKENEETIEKIKEIKEKISISELKKELDEQKNLENLLSSLKSEFKIEKNNLEVKEKSVRTLDTIPCGDKFPECKFIKSSFINKSKIKNQKERVENLFKEVERLNKKLLKSKEYKIEEKLEKYKQLLAKEKDLNYENEKKVFEEQKVKTDIKYLNESILRGKTFIEKNQDNVSSKNPEEDEISERLSELKNEISSKSDEKDRLIQENAKIENEILTSKKEKESFLRLKEKWELYNLYMEAMGKKGISLQILQSQIPIINKEISNILSNIPKFDIELEAEANSNNLNIFVDDGKTKDVVETCCGMEKLFASLALRIALLRVSKSLPSCNTLFIDEGLDGLDEANEEECFRMLNILKDEFKSIFLITHKKSIKSMVDSFIEIKKEKGFSKING